MTYSSAELLANGVSLDALELRRWRRAHRLTQVEMALLAGVSVHALRRAETGKERSLKTKAPVQEVAAE